MVVSSLMVRHVGTEMSERIV